MRGYIRKYPDTVLEHIQPIPVVQTGLTDIHALPHSLSRVCYMPMRDKYRPTRIIAHVRISDVTL